MRSKLITIQCLSLCDIGLAIYTYFTLSNFSEFKKTLINTVEINSPDLQLQIYKVFLQTLTFVSVSLVLVHLVIYYLFYKDKKFAKAYVKYYAALAGVSLLISAYVLKQFSLIIPAAIYFFGLHHALKHDPLTPAKTKTKPKTAV